MPMTLIISLLAMVDRLVVDEASVIGQHVLQCTTVIQHQILPMKVLAFRDKGNFMVPIGWLA